MRWLMQKQHWLHRPCQHNAAEDQAHLFPRHIHTQAALRVGVVGNAIVYIGRWISILFLRQTESRLLKKHTWLQHQKSDDDDAVLSVPALDHIANNSLKSIWLH